MKTWEAIVTLPSGGRQRVTVQADTWYHAKQLFEAQYGASRVSNVRECR
jgi:hypothetical protein